MQKVKEIRNRNRRFLRISCLVVLTALVLGSVLASARSQESRPRNTQTPPPRPTPTAPPVQTTPAPARPAATSTPTPASSPTPKQIDRIAPTLGEPPPPPKLKPTPTPTPPETLDPDSIIKINTELVNLQVRVIDRNNRPINNVSRDEFHVFEDGVPQTIQEVSREEVPISYGLAVDTSGSLRTQLTSVIDAGKTIINANKPGDETFLVRFISSDKIETVQDFTPNKEALIDGIDGLYVEGGQTSVVDAVYLSAEHVAEYKKGDDVNDRRRRALIVITDGEDRNSFYKQEQLFARLREEDVQIFVIGFVGELDSEAGFIRKSSREKAVSLINKLATETGGRAFFPQSITELPQIAGEIIRDLRTQYIVVYSPTNKTPDGTFRAIKVSVDQPSGSDKRIALTRNGRIAKRESPTSPRTPSVRLPSTGATKKP
ncbi:MAG TPA: VWA domain-containing protein [Pyrinomonadaceae bacterium]|nr:VWA domain-containing protein [Pyrinomonadaceae bacterium]